MAKPVFYSFRRCPYAMRARLALTASDTQVELREIILRNKPAEMIEASPKATVPVLVEDDGNVVDESLDVMIWALRQNDPENWLSPELGDEKTMLDLIERIDGDFKHHLDNYKYASRKAPSENDVETYAADHRQSALDCLQELEIRLETNDYLFGKHPSLADFAIAPFVRQYANTDKDWFAANAPKNIQRWLEDFVTSDLFQGVMEKFPLWESSTSGITFPKGAALA